MPRRRPSSAQPGPIEQDSPLSSNRRQEAAVTLSAALRPVVNVCLELGVTSPEMERILRGVFVQEADWLLSRTKGSRTSDLRIGLMTGVHRNFVREIRATRPCARLHQVRQRHRADALLRAWATDLEYLTSAGAPRELPIQEPPNAPSFAALVRRFMPGVSARTAIAELRRSGAIQLLPDEKVRLRLRTVRPSGITEAGLAALADRLSQLATTLLHNLRHPENPRFSEGFTTSPLAAERLPFVRQTVAKRAQNFLDVLAEELKGEDSAGPMHSSSTMTITVYVHEADSERSASAKRRRSARR